MTLRKATPTDLKTVISWIGNAAACRTWAGPVVRFPMTVRSLKIDIAFEEDNTYCLDRGGRLLAFGQLIRKSELGLHMARIIVAPDQRHKGYGKDLGRLLMSRARKKGCRRISLNVYRDNAPACRLYIGLGFRRVAEKSTDELCHMIARCGGPGNI